MNRVIYKVPMIEDHPHACGDKHEGKIYVKVVAGSSPRVWGQDSASQYASGVEGIIPTRVGTSGFQRFPALTLQDHPHACGDKQRKKEGEQGA